MGAIRKSKGDTICVIIPTTWGHPASIVFCISCKQRARQWNHAHECNKGKHVRYLSQMFECKILQEEQSLSMNFGGGEKECICQYFCMLIIPASFQSGFKVTPMQCKTMQSVHLQLRSYELWISCLQREQGAVRGRELKSVIYSRCNFFRLQGNQKTHFPLS